MVGKADAIPDNAINQDDQRDPDKDQERLRLARRRWQVHQAFWTQIHATGLEDDKFVAGEQWPDEIKKDRENDGRPILTYNLLPAMNRQIVNKVREERPQIKVLPVESGPGQTPTIANVQGTKDYPIADVLGGIIKNIEHQSRADHAYDTALKHAVDHGFGWFYVRNKWARWNPFAQELEICRVKNSYSITMDPAAREADYSDAQDAFMFTRMERKTFEAKYPDATASNWAASSQMGAQYDGWWTQDEVQVAQYWCIEYIDDEVLMLSNGAVVYLSEVEDVLDELERDDGIYIALKDGEPMRRKTKRPICKWMKMTGSDILDEADLPFEMIPVFPVLGEEVLVDGETRYESAIRHAKDPQRSYNYWRTSAAETIALAPRAPFILTTDQVAGHENEFERANVDNPPYLAYNYREGQPPPQRAYLKNIPAAELALATQDGKDMQTIIGLHDASLGRESNEKSGKAILARQQQGSTATFQFPDNLNRALEAMGRCLVQAIPKVYDTRQVMRIRLNDETEDFVELFARKKDEQSGEEITVHDIGYGRYDVVIETGPSYSTQRQEAADLQMQLLDTLGPEKAQSIVHLIVKNLGVPGSEEVATVLRKLLPDELKSEDERAADLPKGVVFDDQGNPVYEESGQPYQKPPTQAEQIAMQEATAETKKHEATIAMAEAKKTEAQAKIAEAQRPPENPADQLDPAKMTADIEEIIRQVMQEHESNPKAHAEAVADAIVDALRRSKGYVDNEIRKLGNGSQQPQTEQGAQNV